MLMKELSEQARVLITDYIFYLVHFIIGVCIIIKQEISVRKISESLGYK